MTATSSRLRLRRLERTRASRSGPCPVCWRLSLWTVDPSQQAVYIVGHDGASVIAEARPGGAVAWLCPACRKDLTGAKLYIGFNPWEHI